jgi:hypothetical protein
LWPEFHCAVARCCQVVLDRILLYFSELTYLVIYYFPSVQIWLACQYSVRNLELECLYFCVYRKFVCTSVNICPVIVFHIKYVIFFPFDCASQSFWTVVIYIGLFSLLCLLIC